jgi:hypothetical protein
MTDTGNAKPEVLEREALLRQAGGEDRVHLGRLRSKLIEYYCYATEGADDRLIVEIPKGS